MQGSIILHLILLPHHRGLCGDQKDDSGEVALQISSTAPLVMGGAFFCQKNPPNPSGEMRLVSDQENGNHFNGMEFLVGTSLSPPITLNFLVQSIKSICEGEPAEDYSDPIWTSPFYAIPGP